MCTGTLVHYLQTGILGFKGKKCRPWDTGMGSAGGRGGASAGALYVLKAVTQLERLRGIMW